MSPRTRLFTLLVFGSLLSHPTRALANTIKVTTKSDEYDTSGSGTGCSLREAISAANLDKPFGGCATGHDDDVIFLPKGEYKLTRAGSDTSNVNGDLDIGEGVLISGENAATTTINAQQIDRVLRVLPAPHGHGVELTGVTLRGGKTDTSGGGAYVEGILYLRNVRVTESSAAHYGGALATKAGARLEVYSSTLDANHSGLGGGAIHNFATTIVWDSTLRYNYTEASGTTGGAILNESETIVQRTSLYGNTAEGHGGGLANSGHAADAKLLNTTISGNHAKGNGGGLWNTGTAKMALYNDTVAENQADSNNSNTGEGGGLFTDSGTVSVNNSIIADNVRRSSLPSPDDCNGTIDSLGYNLIETPDNCTIDHLKVGNKIGQDPKLAALADNGGPGRTHRLKGGSQALESGDLGGCRDYNGNHLTTDGRSATRPRDYDGVFGPQCDMGAYESISLAPCPVKPATPLPVDQSIASFDDVQLQWSDALCATRYRLLVREDAKDGTLFVKARTHDVSTYHLPRPLVVGKTYWWRVKACNKHGCKRSPWSSFVAAWPE